jgi:hypothetical protein
MAEQRNQITLSASKVILKLNNKILGFAESCEARVSYSLIPVPTGFGSIMPFEHVINEWSGTLTLSKTGIKHKTLQQLGLAPYANGALTLPPIKIELLTVEGPEIFTFEGCTLQDYSISTQRSSVIMESSTWVALSQLVPNAFKASVNAVNTDEWHV